MILRDRGEPLLFRFAYLAIAIIFATSAKAETGGPTGESSTELPPRRVLIGETTIIPGYSYIDKDDGRLKGVSIDFAREVFRDIGYDVEFNIVDHDKKLDGVRDGTADFCPANVGITEKRGEQVLFSDPIVVSYLAGATKTRPRHFFASFFRIIFGPNGVLLISVIVGLVFFAVLLWWKDHGDVRICDKPWPGIPQAMYHVGNWFLDLDWDYQATGTWGKAIPVIIRICRIMLLAGLLTSGLLESKRDADEVDVPVTQLEDLHNVRISVKKGTTSADLAREISANVLEFDSVLEATQAVTSGKAKVTIHDQGPLQLLINEQFRGKIQLTGPALRAELYGIALRPDFPDKKKLDQAIRAARERGLIQQLSGKHLGSTLDL